jgi:hypothetical protein
MAECFWSISDLVLYFCLPLFTSQRLAGVADSFFAFSPLLQF